MNYTIDNLTPIQKISVILAQYPRLASQIMKHYSMDEIQEVTLEIANLKDIPQSLIDQVMHDFMNYYEANKHAVQGGVATARRILEPMFGAEKTEEMLKLASDSLEVSPFNSIKTVDPMLLANFLQDAQPQIIATLLAYLNDVKKSAMILSGLRKDKQAAVIQGLVDMETIGPSEEVVRALETFVDKKMGSMIIKNRNFQVGGIDSVVPIISSVDRATEKSIMEQIEDKNPNLAEVIRKKMFVFEDLLKLSDKDIQLILQQQLDQKELAQSLKYATQAIQDKFFKNMSKRKGEMIREEMELLTRVKKSDVEEAQQKITLVAKELADKGDIIIGGGSDEYLD